MFNIFVLVFLAVAIAIFLAVFITRQKIPGNVQLIPPEDDFKKDVEEKKLSMKDLERVAEAICTENGLKIKERITDEENYWIVESTNEFFFGTYVIGFFETSEEKPFVTMSMILEFKDFTKSVGSSKGFYLTTGFFTQDVHQPLEGVKVSLYNKLKVLEQMKRFKLG